LLIFFLYAKTVNFTRLYNKKLLAKSMESERDGNIFLVKKLKHPHTTQNKDTVILINFNCKTINEKI